jgi:hypothetical protein
MTSAFAHQVFAPVLCSKGISGGQGVEFTQHVTQSQYMGELIGCYFHTLHSISFEKRFYA